jgi:hypothetical protein
MFYVWARVAQWLEMGWVLKVKLSPGAHASTHCLDTGISFPSVMLPANEVATHLYQIWYSWTHFQCSFWNAVFLQNTRWWTKLRHHFTGTLLELTPCLVYCTFCAMNTSEFELIAFRNLHVLGYRSLGWKNVKRGSVKWLNRPSMKQSFLHRNHLVPWWVIQLSPMLLSLCFTFWDFNDSS